MPTQMVWEGIIAYSNNKNGMQKDMDYIPEGRFKDYYNEFYKAITNSDPGFANTDAYCKSNREYIKGMIRLGGKLAIGTDTPC